MTDRPPAAPARQRPSVGAVIRHYVPIVSWLPAYDRADLRFDAIAGLVSWGVMVPVAMAYAGLAGVPPELGLVTAFASLTAYAIFGTSRHLKVTASSSVAILSASVVAAIGASQDPATFVTLTAALALIVGAILVVAGAARLGFLSQFLAASVVTGFVIGLAVTITVGQIPALLGTPGRERDHRRAARRDRAGDRRARAGHGGARDRLDDRDLRPEARRAADPRRARRAGRRDRALDRRSTSRREGVAVVGEVATGIPSPSIPRIPIGDVVFLVTGAFGIVFLALAESIGAARSFGARHGYDIDPDQELIALGSSNVASGLFGGFPVDASFSQSATGEASGNRTQLASLITAALVLATAIVLAPIFRNLPTSVLAAIVIVSVVSLVNLGELRRYLAWRRTDFLLAMTALGGVVFTTALTGMAIAVALSLLAILYQASRPYIAVLGRIPGRPPVYADAGRHATAEPVEGFLVLRPNVPLTFVNADVAKDQIMALIAERSGRAARARARHRRDRRPRCRDDGHARRPSRGARRTGHRRPAGAGARIGPRPDAADGPDDDHRRGPLLPVGRGGGRGDRGRRRWSAGAEAEPV